MKAVIFHKTIPVGSYPMRSQLFRQRGNNTRRKSLKAGQWDPYQQSCSPLSLRSGSAKARPLQNEGLFCSLLLHHLLKIEMDPAVESWPLSVLRGLSLGYYSHSQASPIYLVLTVPPSLSQLLCLELQNCICPCRWRSR